ncbi:MAG: N-acetylglucosamine-6-phosphate deacetylase [Pirellulales bacterium]
MTNHSQDHAESPPRRENDAVASIRGPNAKAPHFVDLQVNGYAGADFNSDDLSVDAMRAACRRLRADGVAGILATVITDRPAAMLDRLARIAALRDQDPLIADVVWGIHIEGPFLNAEPGYIGAHPVDAARPADADFTRQLLEAAGGLTRIFTLAPECDPRFEVTRLLADEGIIVSAGHCNPDLETLRRAIDAGLSMFTHLGNGCPLQLHRHDNVIQRALNLADHLWIGLIADGVHVPYPALANYLRCAGLDRALVVTDAISAAGLGPGTYQFGGQQVLVDEQLATWSADRSHLMGSAGTMPRTAQNLRTALELTDQQVAQLTSDNPRKILRAER